MKKIATLALLIFVLAPGGYSDSQGLITLGAGAGSAAPAGGSGRSLVQARAGYTSGTSAMLAFAGNVTANNVIGVACVDDTSAATTLSVSDSQMNTWSNIDAGFNLAIGGTHNNVHSFWAKVGSTGADTVKCSDTASSDIEVEIIECQGCTNTGPVDVATSWIGGTTSTSAVTSNSISAGTSGTLIFVAFMDSGCGGGSATAGGGFAIPSGAIDTAYVGAVEYQIASGTFSGTAALTDPCTDSTWGVGIASLK